jgi:hypothetical protein
MPKIFNKGKRTFSMHDIDGKVVHVDKNKLSPELSDKVAGQFIKDYPREFVSFEDSKKLGVSLDPKVVAKLEKDNQTKADKIAELEAELTKVKDTPKEPNKGAAPVANAKK